MENAKKEDNTDTKDRNGYKKPEGTLNTHTLKRENDSIEYTAQADWILLDEDQEAKAEMFYVAYTRQKYDSQTRPVTFVFNGGPGAASAYLHIGAMGPETVYFEKDGAVPAGAAKLVPNENTWLDFTDLVFIDPIGTGFSRVILDKLSDEEKEKRKKEYYSVSSDLNSLGEFMQRYLSQNKRWSSPVYIAGESYGGFRTAKLCKLLQQGFGIGLNGAILISPALEFATLNPSDYDVLHYIDSFPSLCAAASFHGKSTKFPKGTDIYEITQKAEDFASNRLAAALIYGDNQENLSQLLKDIEAYTGIPSDFLKQQNFRLNIHSFARELLKQENMVCGLYDATVAIADPFPGREYYEGPDPTLFSIERLFMAGINILLRDKLQLETTRTYKLLSLDVNQAWKPDEKDQRMHSQVGSVDDLRYGMAINPHMKTFVCHGYYDLVTPYHASNRIARQMQLTDAQKEKLTIQHFPGGHMFYSRSDSKRLFFEALKTFYQ